MAIGINLLPAGEKNLYRQRRVDSKVFLIAMIICVGIIGTVAMLFFYLTLMKYDIQATRDQIEKNKNEITTLKPIHEKYSYLASNIEQFETLKDKGIDFEQTLREISAIVPSNTTINSLNFSVLPTPIINISATASSRREGFRFYEKMKANPKFSNTTLQTFAMSGGSSNKTATKKNEVSLSLSVSLATTSPTQSKEVSK